MMVCLRELSVVFTTRPDQLLRVVIEDLRHLDTAVTLAFVKARADFASRDANHFSNKLRYSKPNVTSAPLTDRLTVNVSILYNELLIDDDVSALLC
jgi:hypothetical protein